jgi:hypothetical protein
MSRNMPLTQKGRAHRAATVPHALGSAPVDRPKTRVVIGTSSLHLPTVAALGGAPERGGGTAACIPDMVSLGLAARAHPLGAWPSQDVYLSAPRCPCRCASRDVSAHASPPASRLGRTSNAWGIPRQREAMSCPLAGNATSRATAPSSENLIHSTPSPSAHAANRRF